MNIKNLSLRNPDFCFHRDPDGRTWASLDVPRWDPEQNIYLTPQTRDSEVLEIPDPDWSDFPLSTTLIIWGMQVINTTKGN